MIEPDQGDDIEELYLWPDNVAGWDLFQTVSTQWNIGLNGVIGLQYAGVQAAMELTGIPRKQRPALFRDVQVCERATLEALAERREQQQ